jgi:secretion/DNA translocation related TadE-like protein
MLGPGGDTLPLGVNNERGSVSILVAAVIAALLVLAMGAADVARVFVAASKAQTAADAAALAAAQELAVPQDGPTPIDLAREFAERNGAVLDTCECEPGTFVATVSVRVGVRDLFLVAGDRAVVARARAEVELPES